MNDFKLKPNEIMIFTDFNNTLVDYENEYNYSVGMYDEDRASVTRIIKANITKALTTFEKKTGLTPVICVVTNASAFAIGSNSYAGISQDMHMTFFNHLNQSDEIAKHVYETSCEKYFRFLVYKENDFYCVINPIANSLEEMFTPVLFDENALKIKYIPDFKKKESVDRMMTVVDPEKTRSKYIIFAGDSIKDDYPMKLIETPEGVCKIFIRPGKVQKAKPSVMREFCEAKGDEFFTMHPKTGKRIKCLDESTVKYLSDKERQMLENYSDGDHVLLTNKNSRGFIEGIYAAIDIINKTRAEAGKEMQ